MLKTALHNGIDFSGKFNRENSLFNFEAQRVKNILPVANLGTLCFETLSNEYNYIFIHNITNGTVYVTERASVLNLTSSFLVFFNIEDTDFTANTDVYFEVRSGADASDYTSLFSEIYRVKSPTYLTENRIAKLTAYNNDARRGFATSANPAFGFFQTTGFNEDVFINKKTEYEYSYGRRKILSSENNIGKRFTFLDLTMYQQNLLKWLCNTENLFIDGVRYELISDFTELLADENSEVKDLRADFVEVEQSFFMTGSSLAPSDKFSKEFFVWRSSKMNNFNNGFDYTLPFNLY